MNKPLISIITVVYNNKEGIKKTIQSVIHQSYTHIEYIVIDGGSTDGTKEIIQNYENNLAQFISAPDKGIYDAMNKGIAMATGEIIGMINSGDYLETNCVEEVVNAYVENPFYDVYHGMLRVFSVSGEFKYIIGNDHSFLKQGMIEHPTCFVKSKVYDTHGCFSLNYKSSADYEFMLRIFQQSARFYFIEKILANFYAGGISSRPTAILETLKIRHSYGYISTIKRILFENFIKLKFSLKNREVQ